MLDLGAEARSTQRTDGGPLQMLRVGGDNYSGGCKALLRSLVVLALQMLICRVGAQTVCDWPCWQACHNLCWDDDGCGHCEIPVGVEWLVREFPYEFREHTGDGSAVISLAIPGTVRHITPKLFYGSLLQNVTIGYGVETIGPEAFAFAEDLTSVTVSAREIGEAAFESDGYGEQTLNLTLGTGVEIIGPRAFRSWWLEAGGSPTSGLTSVIIPDTVREIHDEAFYGHPMLTSVVIPRSVIFLSPSAFPDHTSLEFSDAQQPDPSPCNFRLLMDAVRASIDVDAVQWWGSPWTLIQSPTDSSLYFTLLRQLATDPTVISCLNVADQLDEVEVVGSCDDSP